MNEFKMISKLRYSNKNSLKTFEIFLNCKYLSKSISILKAHKHISVSCENVEAVTQLN